MKWILMLVLLVGCVGEESEPCTSGASECLDAWVLNRCIRGEWVAEDCRVTCPDAFPAGRCEPHEGLGQSNCGCYEAP